MTKSTNVSTTISQETTLETTEAKDVTNLCDSIDTALSVSHWGDYGVKIDSCASVVADNGEDAFLLIFNDPAEWEDLYLALGDIPAKDVARYAFWRAPLGLLSIGFTIANETPNRFGQIAVYFNNPKQTVYDVLPRDIAYIIDIPDSFSKEEYSKEMNERLDEVSERVDVYNLNE